MDRTTFSRDTRAHRTRLDKSTNNEIQGRQLLLTGIFLLGLLAGRLLIDKDSGTLNQAMLELVSGYLSGSHLENVGQTFLATFSSALFLLLILLFCGFCAISPPVIYAVIFFRGAGIGLTYGTLFLNFGWQALPYVTIILLPSAALSIFILMAAANEALLLSRRFLVQLLGKSTQAIPVNIQRIGAKFLLFAGGLAFAALLEGLLLFLFGRVLGMQ